MRLGMRLLVFVLLMLGLMAAFYFFGLEPRNRQLAEARRETQAKQAKLAQLETATRSIANMGEEID